MGSASNSPRPDQPPPMQAAAAQITGHRTETPMPGQCRPHPSGVPQIAQLTEASRLASRGKGGSQPSPTRASVHGNGMSRSYLFTDASSLLASRQPHGWRGRFGGENFAGWGAKTTRSEKHTS